MKVTDDSEVYVYTVGLGYSKVGIIIESSDEAFTIWSMDGIVTVSLNDDGSLHYASDGAYGIDVDNVTKEIRLAFEYNYQIVYVATLKDGKVDSDTFGLDDPDVKLGYTFNGWFILKGYDNIFFSRSNQIQMFIEKMQFNALFGTGFLTPFVPYKQQFIFSFNYVVEDGNILLATLGYIGIIGFIIIVFIYYFIFSRNRDKKYIVLFFVPILISFGEMTFYSSNNMACLFYICYGIYFYSGINIFNKHSQKYLNIQKKNDI